MKVKQYIRSFRLRTLPLSMSGIILGSFLAEKVDIYVFILTVLTTLCLQILSNLSNELGDWQKGADTSERQGINYSLQMGALSELEFKKCIWTFAALSLVFGVALVWAAFGSLCKLESLIFLILGVFAIVAAVTYTLGKHAYGYKGRGDVSVFIFFGLLSVCGAYYLQELQFSLHVLLPATAIGFLSVAVLNVNNIRDMQQDVLVGKHTFASKLGPRISRVYHFVLVFAAIILLCLSGYFCVLFLAPILIWHVIMVFRQEGKPLDKQLPILVLTTFAISVLISVLKYFAS